MTANVPQLDTPAEASVRRLMDDFMTDLAAILDQRDRRVRVYPLSSLLAIHLLAALGDGNGLDDAADLARDHAA